MAEPILWATLIIAASSLIFAFIAFRQVMRSTKSVDGFLKRADKLLSNFSKGAKGIFTPKFMAATIEEAVTSGLKNEDGSQVTMPQYIAGWAHAVGPGVYADLKKEIPNYIPLILNPQNANPSPGAPQNRQANGQWGSGGLTAAVKVGKAAQKLPIGGKIAEYVGGAQAVVGLVGPIKELVAEIRGPKGGNGQDEAPSTSTAGASVEWGPPF